MRLIDADLFEKEIKAVAQGQATSLMPDMVELSVETIVETLDEVPTAYDVDKVIKEIESCFNATEGKGRRLAYHRAITIVKGGINGLD